MPRRRLILPLVLGLSLGLAGCGSGAAKSGNTAVNAAATQQGDESAPVTGTRATSNVDGQLTIRKGPSKDSGVLVRLSATTSLGTVRTLLVDPAKATQTGWVPVLLPTRPNGSSGWVAADDVRLENVHDRITVDLTRRHMQIYIDGKQITDALVAIGPKADPTPRGLFYVIDRIKAKNPGGGYGPFALGLSAHSPTLSAYGGGDAQIGIHGTDKPESIGKPATHGCIRVTNDIAKLLEQVPLGTPVQIS